ncbi:MAG: DUF3352 domain-containing protein [Stenomitos rutilans HA7619-LM2]|nr:DUF3352 domain-containing protein [Stenomitos rutilans HA7619-LM2]
MLRCASVSFSVAVAILSGSVIARAVPLPQPSPPAVTTVLPANTPGVVLVNVTPTAWAEVDRFNPLPDSLRVPFKVPFLPDEIEFAQDIQPWLGDQVAIALVPTAGSIASSVLQTFDSSAILLVPITKPDRFDAFLHKLKATRGKPNIEREYKGVMLLEWSAPPESTPPVVKPDATTQRTLPPSTVFGQRQSPWSAISRFADGTANKAVTPNVPPVPPLAPDESPTPTPSPSPTEAKGLAIALLPGNVAVAAQVQTLEDLIDARSEREPLAQSRLFQRTLQHPQTGRSLVTSYGEVSAIAKFLWTIAKNSPSTADFGLPSLSESQLTALTKLYSTVDSHIWLQPEGIHSQVNFYYTTPQPKMATRAVPDANQILSRLPSATYLSANSRNFKQQWQDSLDSAQDDLASQIAIASLRNGFRTATGLDPEKDVIPWMDGEYAFFFFPTTGGFFNYLYPKLNLGLGLIVQTSDRQAAEAALKKLDQFIKKEAKGEVAIVPQQFKGQPIVSWETKEKGKTISFLSYGWVDAKTLVITTGSKPMADLAPKPYLPLHLNHTFQTATASFPLPNDGYFYVNMGATLSFFYSLILPSAPTEDSVFVQEFQRIAGSVRSVSTSNSATAEVQRVDSLWVLAPVKQSK